MKTFVVILCLVSIVTMSSVTHAAELYVGPLGGVNWGDLSGLDQANASSGFTGGAFLQADFTAEVGVRLSGVYTQKGAQYNSNDLVNGAQNVEVSLDYIDVPLVLMVELTGSATSAFSLYAGPVMSFSLGGKAKPDNLAEVDLADHIAGTEFSAVMGAEGEHIRSSFSVFVDFQYTIGATSVFDSVPQGTAARFLDTKNRGFALVAGLKFGLGG